MSLIFSDWLHMPSLQLDTRHIRKYAGLEASILDKKCCLCIRVSPVEGSARQCIHIIKYCVVL